MKNAAAVPRSLLLAYIIIGWLIALLLFFAALYVYLQGDSLVQHSLFAFSGEVLLWLPVSEVTGSPPPLGAIPLAYDEATTRYLGDAMSRYMEWYADHTIEYEPRSGTSLLRAIYTENGKEMSCLVVDVPGSDALLVLFKGTTSHFEWNIDFTYQTTSPQSMFSSSGEARAQSIPRWSHASEDNEGVRIHKGFAEFYATMRGQILDAVETSGRTNVFICGHSLGAGVSNVFMFDLLDSGTKTTEQVYCATIGSPRVGNPAFAAFMASHDVRLFQLRNTADVVPLIPLAWTPSLQGKKELYEYEHAGTGMLFENRSNNLKGAHMLAAYQTHMLSSLLTPYDE